MKRRYSGCGGGSSSSIAGLFFMFYILIVSKELDMAKLRHAK